MLVIEVRMCGIVLLFVVVIFGFCLIFVVWWFFGSFEVFLGWVENLWFCLDGIVD